VGSFCRKETEQIVGLLTAADLIVVTVYCREELSATTVPLQEQDQTRCEENRQRRRFGNGGICTDACTAADGLAEVGTPQIVPGLCTTVLPPQHVIGSVDFAVVVVITDERRCRGVLIHKDIKVMRRWKRIKHGWLQWRSMSVKGDGKQMLPDHERRDAFARLFEQHDHWLFAYPVSLLSNAAHAEEVFQPNWRSSRRIGTYRAIDSSSPRRPIVPCPRF
jgi:hypothetical protein